jgi:macrodomain Ter protein organizer (MatP/YcbG family)
MYKHIVIAVRPNINVEWAWNILDKTERDSDFKTRYIDTGLMISNVSSISEDGLTITFTRTWESKSSYDDFISNPFTIDLIEKYDQYNNDNNIIVTRTTEQL